MNDEKKGVRGTWQIAMEEYIRTYEDKLRCLEGKKAMKATDNLHLRILECLW